ncbi:MAG: flagellar hook-length control protein FliK [Candidatus Accumulibacter sp.]|jgi:flagellar hook-length control protein FliK|nr:flagellar hook-length control protein FliK [Accumulibacter sp.]
MTIAIVSALPKSSPPPAMNFTAGTDSLGTELDFTSLLLGQLDTLVQPGAGLNLGITLAATANAPENPDFGEEDTAVGDPLDLLATLTQAPLEQRRNGALAESATPSTDLTGKAIGNERLQMSERAAQETPQVKLSPANGQAANGQAAKFAVFAGTMSGENAAGRQESSELSSAATVVAATNTPARREDAAPTLAVPTPLNDRGWNNDFAQKVTWVATNNKQFAELTLNPPTMGSIEISIKLDNDKSTAIATFVSSNAEVRETIETAMPRLREMLANVGIALGQTQVGAESFRQAPGNEQNQRSGVSQSGNDMAILAPDSPADRSVSPNVGAGRGLVDMFV